MSSSMYDKYFPEGSDVEMFSDSDDEEYLPSQCESSDSSDESNNGEEEQGSFYLNLHNKF